MSRDIKFRGKCSGQSKYAGEWVEGGLVVPQEITNNEVLIIRAIADGCTTTYHVDADTIGQYTGLNDKNGKEIYEGDIVKAPLLDPIFGDILSDAFDNAPVAFHNGAFTVDYYQGSHKIYLQDLYDKIEVIGNIHDNKDLLED